MKDKGQVLWDTLGMIKSQTHQLYPFPQKGLAGGQLKWQDIDVDMFLQVAFTNRLLLIYAKFLGPDSKQTTITYFVDYSSLNVFCYCGSKYKINVECQ